MGGFQSYRCKNTVPPKIQKPTGRRPPGPSCTYISNYIPNKGWNVIIHPCPNFNGALITFELRHGWVITSQFYTVVITCPFRDPKLISVSKRGLPIVSTKYFVKRLQRDSYYACVIWRIWQSLKQSQQGGCWWPVAHLAPGPSQFKLDWNFVQCNSIPGNIAGCRAMCKNLSFIL